ncbi:hypothetical protein HYPSUDRAFT_360707 [Hypholoma sublateritium FD-334 SS-4]|uniref:Secreted protein n=1 Tax=Hypholoma sublateritium (strain FD-334 SS-4) TaxID=945553 RepID=A0A0D2P551_HYPSF|nr:hypothetical protein HYPSUDRAFT_360707 [Hypholoma sublateritium FD-334 SS-4]
MRGDSRSRVRGACCWVCQLSLLYATVQRACYPRLEVRVDVDVEEHIHANDSERSDNLVMLPGKQNDHRRSRCTTLRLVAAVDAVVIFAAGGQYSKLLA